MKRGDIYRRAAKWLDRQPLDARVGMCEAIDSVHTDPESWWLDHNNKFGHRFSPTKVRSLWWGEQWSADIAERRNCRIIALLLAAAMADTGDL